MKGEIYIAMKNEEKMKSCFVCKEKQSLVNFTHKDANGRTRRTEACNSCVEERRAK